MKKAKQKPKYRKLLNKRDPIDEHILKLAKKDEMRVGIVQLNRY